MQYILEQGPTVGDTGALTLKVVAEGWPLPTFQWFKNGNVIVGATSAELHLKLGCDTYGARSYRCIKCKMVSRNVPLNAYHIKCGNCGQLFAYKDVRPVPLCLVRFISSLLHRLLTLVSLCFPCILHVDRWMNGCLLFHWAPAGACGCVCACIIDR